MSLFISQNSTHNSVQYEDAYGCMDVPSFIWQTVSNLFSESVPEPLPYQRKVQIISLMSRSSFAERLKLLEDLDWMIDYDKKIAIHPKGQIYALDELAGVLELKLAKILEATCVFAETIGYRYEDSEGLFTNGEERVSMEMLGSLAKNRQL
jgi:hypothetical protein